MLNIIVLKLPDDSRKVPKLNRVVGGSIPAHEIVFVLDGKLRGCQAPHVFQKRKKEYNCPYWYWWSIELVWFEKQPWCIMYYCRKHWFLMGHHETQVLFFPMFMAQEVYGQTYFTKFTMLTSNTFYRRPLCNMANPCWTIVWNTQSAHEKATPTCARSHSPRNLLYTNTTLHKTTECW